MEHGWGGRWRGSYHNLNALHERGGHNFGIQAQLEQWGGGITGTMIDLDPAHTVPLRDLASSPVGESWSSVERRNAALWLARYPDAVVRSTLPERSELVGTASKDGIEFEKRYLGAQTIVWLDGGRELGRSSIAEHKVQYWGTMSADGLTIAGTWTIRAPGLLGILGKSLGTGDFRLAREG